MADASLPFVFLSWFVFKVMGLKWRLLEQFFYDELKEKIFLESVFSFCFLGLLKEWQEKYFWLLKTSECCSVHIETLLSSLSCLAGWTKENCYYFIWDFCSCWRFWRRDFRYLRIKYFRHYLWMMVAEVFKTYMIYFSYFFRFGFLLLDLPFYFLLLLLV